MTKDENILDKTVQDLLNPDGSVRMQELEEFVSKAVEDLKRKDRKIETLEKVGENTFEFLRDFFRARIKSTRKGVIKWAYDTVQVDNGVYGDLSENEIAKKVTDALDPLSTVPLNTLIESVVERITYKSDYLEGLVEEYVKEKAQNPNLSNGLVKIYDSKIIRLEATVEQLQDQIAAYKVKLAEVDEEDHESTGDSSTEDDGSNGGVHIVPDDGKTADDEKNDYIIQLNEYAARLEEERDQLVSRLELQDKQFQATIKAKVEAGVRDKLKKSKQRTEAQTDLSSQYVDIGDDKKVHVSQLLQLYQEEIVERQKAQLLVSLPVRLQYGGDTLVELIDLDDFDRDENNDPVARIYRLPDDSSSLIDGSNPNATVTDADGVTYKISDLIAASKKVDGLESEVRRLDRDLKKEKRDRDLAITTAEGAKDNFYLGQLEDQKRKAEEANLELKKVQDELVRKMRELDAAQKAVKKYSQENQDLLDKESKWNIERRKLERRATEEEAKVVRIGDEKNAVEDDLKATTADYTKEKARADGLDVDFTKVRREFDTYKKDTNADIADYIVKIQREQAVREIDVAARTCLAEGNEKDADNMYLLLVTSGIKRLTAKGKAPEDVTIDFYNVVEDKVSLLQAIGESAESRGNQTLAHAAFTKLYDVGREEHANGNDILALGVISGKYGKLDDIRDRSLKHLPPKAPPAP